MGADSAMLERTSGPVLRLDFEMGWVEHSEVYQKAWTSRHAWVMPACGLLLVANAAYQLGLHQASRTTGHSWFFEFKTLVNVLLGWNFVTNNSLLNWLARKLSHRVTHTMLEFDSDGIRGLFEFPSGWRKGPEVKHINYTWLKVRRIYRPAGYVMLEFHGGGTVTIPERAFATRDDLRQCLAWADDGLAQQWKTRTFRHVAA